MAILFDTNTDYVRIADNAALTLPDADWAIQAWGKLANNSSTVSERWFDWDNGSSAAIRLYITQSAGAQDELHLRVYDGADGADIESTSSPFASNTNWTHVLAQRSGSNFELYINGSSVGTVAVGTVDGADVPEFFYIGQYGLVQDRAFDGHLAEYAKWDRALTADEIAALAKGFSPIFFKNSLMWYCPLVRNYVEVIRNLTVSQSGTSVGPHPRMIYPAYTIIGKGTSTTQNLQPPLLTNTPTIYEPTLVKSPYPLTVPLITNAPTFYGPTLAATYSLSAPLLTNSPTFHDPTLVKSVYPLTAPLITNTPTFYGPTLAATYSLTAPLITNTATFPAPAFAATYALTAPLITNTPTFYGPTFAPGAVNLIVPLLSVAATFPSAAFVPGSVNLTVPLLSNAPTFYDVNLVGPQDITAPLLSNSPTLYEPSMRFKWTDVNNVTTGDWTDGDFPFHTI